MGTDEGRTPDARIHESIEGLVEEERELLDREEREGPDEESRRRLEDVRVTLDRLWDLLRQRRAQRRAGRPEDEASLREPETVEDYEQ